MTTGNGTYLDLLLGTGGVSVTLAASFTMPAVWTSGSPTTVAAIFKSNKAMAAGAGLVLPGYGFFIIASVNIDGVSTTLINTGASGNVAAGTTVPSGVQGSVSGSGAPLALSAPQNGQSLQMKGGTLTPTGMRDYVNVLSFSTLSTPVDPTGTLDSRAGIQLAINYAAANGLILYVPFGDYQVYGVLYVPTALHIEGPSDLTGASIQSRFRQDLYMQPVGATYFWGGTWMGPVFRCVPTTTSTPLSFVGPTNGTYRLQFAQLAGTNNAPYIPLGVSPTSSLNGLAALSMEWTVNYRENISLTNPLPYCGGSITDNSSYTQAFSFHTINTGATFGATLSVTTSGGLVSCSTGGSALSTNTDYSTAASYDGSTVKLFMGSPGSAPSITASVSASGSIVQNFWEDFFIGASNSAGGCNYPMTGGANNINKLEWGNFRISNTARSFTTMRGTEFAAADRDSNTNFLMSFAPAYRGSVIGDQASVVATCYSPTAFNYTFAGPGNVFIPIRNAFTGLASFGPAVSFHRLAFYGFEGIDVEASIGVCTYDCYFQVRRGITRFNNCYEWRDINPSFNCAGFNSGNAAYGWGAAYVSNSGLGTLDSANFGSSQGCNFGLLFNNSGSNGFRDFFINLVAGPVGIFVNDSIDFFFENCSLANEGSSTTQYALAVFNRCANIRWRGGAVFSETSMTAGCNVLLDKGQLFQGNAQQTHEFDVDFSGTSLTSIFKCPSSGAPTLPIVVSTALQGQTTQAPFPWSDGSAPIKVRSLEESGRTTWNATGSGAITFQWGEMGSPTGPDFACATTVITDTGAHLTGTTNLVPPASFTGYRRRLVNSTLQTLTWASLSPGVAAGKSAFFESNGSGWERATADI